MTTLHISPLTRTLAAAAAAAALLGGGLLLSPSASAAFPVPAASPTAVPTRTADAQLTATLVFSHEEERMACDLYQLFADTYGDARPFSMIVRSEQQHMEAVGRLLAAYGVADPSVGKAAGVYDDPALQQLYDTWKAQGLVSVTEAAKVGVALEQRDIADLEALIKATRQRDVTDVFTKLLAASRNHLRAFEAAVAGNAPTGSMGSGRPSTGPGQGNGAAGGIGRSGRQGQGGPGQGGLGQGGMAQAGQDGVCDMTGQPGAQSTTRPGQGGGPRNR